MSSPAKTFKKPAPLLEYDLFTGGGTKTADLAIYYNLALDSLNKVKNRGDLFLAEYLWKASLQRKNPNGYILHPKDKAIIAKLVKKVEEIRNFHSHSWHDYRVLAFDQELKAFVEQKFEEAKATLIGERPGALNDFEFTTDQLNERKSNKYKLFKFVQEHQKHFITEEGRIFFLSFFLTTGQMQQLLQQRRGSKRTDTPLYKIKRLLYTSYCHRDGAAIAGFNQDARYVDQIDPITRGDIFKARTAYKLMGYLSDYPAYWGSQQAMPLFAEDGQLINHAEELLPYIERNAVLPGFRFRLLERDGIGEEPGQYELNRLAFTCDLVPGYHFRIDFEALHRLVVLQTLGSPMVDGTGPVEILVGTLKKLAGNRANLYRILSAGKRTAADEAYLLDKQNQFLRGGRKLALLATAFFEALEKEKVEKPRARVTLLNYLRDESTPWRDTPSVSRGASPAPFPPEPIQVYRQDYILGEEQKFRAGNRFVFYTAKFLMDFAGDGWYWGMEKFAMGKKPENAIGESLLKQIAYFKAAEIPENDSYRLTLENEHIYLALLKDAGATLNHQRYWQFAIGPQAMRYFAAYIVANQQLFAKQLNGFLLMLADDLAKLNKAGHFEASDDYQLLEKPFVESYLQSASSEFEEMERSALARVAHVQSQFKDAVKNKDSLSRFEKNSLIMEAYHYFDWTDDGKRPDGKFLRANEYNQLSTCHYCLHLKKDKPSSGRRVVRGKYFQLFNDLFELHKRQPPIPSHIQQLLNAAGSLDELLLLVLRDRYAFLKREVVAYQELKNEERKTALLRLSRLLGLSVPANLLDPEEREKLREKHLRTLQVQPYAIHPMLFVKYFFPSDYVKGKQMTSMVNKDGKVVLKRPALSIFTDLRKNKKLTGSLYPGFYREEIATQLYPAEKQKKQREALTGLINNTKTEDILLWWMALNYLKNEFTQPIADLLTGKAKGTRIDPHHIGELNGLTVCLPLTGLLAESGITTTVYTSVLMHQLDDLMFMTQKDRLFRAAQHFRQRCTGELELWQNDLTRASEKQFGYSPLSLGTKNDPIPFQLLLDELELVRRTGQKFAALLLAFERNVLDDALSGRHAHDKNNFHHWLKNNCGKNPSDNFYFKFEKVLLLSADGGKIDEATRMQLDVYRNIAFHNDIPIEAAGSFSWLTRQGEPVRELLNMKEDLHVKKDRSNYVIPKNEDE